MKKEEENILNKKKKREETKQKNKAEKAKNSIRPHYTNMFMTQMPQYYDFPKYNYSSNQMMFFLNNSIPYYNFPIETKKESDNLIYNYIDNSLKKGIVNHIIGALYILNVQQNKPKPLDKKVVPINTVIHENKIVENTQSLNLKTTDLVNLSLINISGNNNCNIHVKDSLNSTIDNFKPKGENIVGNNITNKLNFEEKNLNDNLNNDKDNKMEDKINNINQIDGKEKNLNENSKEKKEEEDINVNNNEMTNNNLNFENKPNEIEKKENIINEKTSYRTIIS